MEASLPVARVRCSVCWLGVEWLGSHPRAIEAEVVGSGVVCCSCGVLTRAVSPAAAVLWVAGSVRAVPGRPQPVAGRVPSDRLPLPQRVATAFEKWSVVK